MLTKNSVLNGQVLGVLLEIEVETLFENVVAVEALLDEGDESAKLDLDELLTDAVVAVVVVVCVVVERVKDNLEDNIDRKSTR